MDIAEIDRLGDKYKAAIYQAVSAGHKNHLITHIAEQHPEIVTDTKEWDSFFAELIIYEQMRGLANNYA